MPAQPRLLDTQPLTTTVPLPAGLRERALASRPGGTFVLRLGGVHRPSHRSAVFRVFADLPTASHATAAEDPHYLGYFALVPKTLEGPEVDTVTDLTLDVSRQLPRLLRASRGRSLTVTLVPVVGQPPQPAAGLGLVIDRIDVEELHPPGGPG
jgi:hypothetical protein